MHQKLHYSISFPLCKPQPFVKKSATIFHLNVGCTKTPWLAHNGCIFFPKMNSMELQCMYNLCAINSGFMVAPPTKQRNNITYISSCILSFSDGDCEETQCNNCTVTAILVARGKKQLASK